MKKYVIISGSILCLFILCSITIQPIIAIKQSEYISIDEEIQNSVFNKFNLRELKNKILNFEECDCKIRDNYPYFICWILKYFELSIISIATLMIMFIPVISYGIVTILYHMILNILGLQLKLGCEYPDY